MSDYGVILTANSDWYVAPFPHPTESEYESTMNQLRRDRQGEHIDFYINLENLKPGAEFYHYGKRGIVTQIDGRNHILFDLDPS